MDSVVLSWLLGTITIDLLETTCGRDRTAQQLWVALEEQFLSNCKARALHLDTQVVRLFNEVAQMSPEDADVHIVLGVLYNLSREYDKAIASFNTALQLKPQDYSLWNKLGATQANSIQSADAILAYQQVINWFWNIKDDTFSVMRDS
jgi:tetratricopeptide (TPR) repeat protein